MDTKLTPEQLNWLHDALGVKVAESKTEPAEAPNPIATDSESGESQSFGEGILGGLKSVGGGIVGGIKAAGEGVVSIGKTIGQGFVSVERKISGSINEAAVKVANGDYDESMKQLDAEIKNLQEAAVDTTRYEAQARKIRDEHAEAIKQPDITSRYNAVSACSARAKEAAEQIVFNAPLERKMAVEGATAAIGDIRNGVMAQIAKIAKNNPEREELATKLATLDKSIEQAAKVTDRASRARVLKKIEWSARDLFDDAIIITKDESAFRTVLDQALNDKTGIDASRPPEQAADKLEQFYIEVSLHDDMCNVEFQAYGNAVKAASSRGVTPDRDGEAQIALTLLKDEYVKFGKSIDALQEELNKVKAEDAQSERVVRYRKEIVSYKKYGLVTYRDAEKYWAEKYPVANK